MENKPIYLLGLLVQCHYLSMPLATKLDTILLKSRTKLPSSLKTTYELKNAAAMHANYDSPCFTTKNLGISDSRLVSF